MTKRFLYQKIQIGKQIRIRIEMQIRILNTVKKSSYLVVVELVACSSQLRGLIKK
jgi:hypothetical protein